MENNATKNVLTRITLTRLEGDPADCGVPHGFLTLREANEKLREWAETAPKGGAYDKVTFDVEIDGEHAYSGRYDLRGEDADACILHQVRATRSWAATVGRAYVNDEGREAIERAFVALSKSREARRVKSNSAHWKADPQDMLEARWIHITTRNGYSIDLATWRASAADALGSYGRWLFAFYRGGEAFTGAGKLYASREHAYSAAINRYREVDWAELRDEVKA